MSARDLTWQRSGFGWVLKGHRRMGAVVPDAKYPNMWRVKWGDGRYSDMANLSRAKDALSRFASAGEAIRRPPIRPIHPAHETVQ